MAELSWLPGAREDVPEVLQGLDGFVLPSLAEGISNTILEAMACGLPVLATHVGSNAALVQHGHTGLVVAPGEPQQLAAGLMQLVQDPQAARAMGREGRRRVVQRFSLTAMVAAYEGVYRRVLP